MVWIWLWSTKNFEIFFAFRVIIKRFAKAAADDQVNRKQTSPDYIPEIEEGRLFSVSRDISAFVAHLVALWREEDVFESIWSILVFAVKVLSRHFTISKSNLSKL